MGKLQLPPPNFLHFFLLIYWIWLGCLVISPLLIREIQAESDSKHPLRSSIVSRNFTRRGTNALRGNLRHLSRNHSAGIEQESVSLTTPLTNVSEDVSDSLKVEARSEPVSVQHSTKVAGVDKRGKNPEELIRNVLLNHTLEHGGEEDLDKLVFSALPQGKKLVLRTVRIIRTDENGDPIDTAEDSQPTYWDVTLANATADADNEEVTEEDEEEESEEVGEEVASPSENKTVGVTKGKKKPDLESSGSHSAANYHQVNDYGHAGREKEHGKTYHHGNTHGNHHKQTFTVTDAKDVKPFHGTEKGVTDYANGHGGQLKDQGERFKTSKRKNKGRKVSGFKRVYHKEEFQRTEHFFDDEEANKIAESFGLSESKGANNHGTKDDKRKYQGVHTDYLDGKKHENEHGTHDGYHKGQHTQYQETERHKHHNDYGGKSMSQNHGGGGSSYSQPQYHHHDSHGGGYHPNHNYHGSHSAPKKNTVTIGHHQHHPLPASVADQIGKIAKERANAHSQYQSVPAIFSAPMATSFSVTEFSPAAHSPGDGDITPTVVVSHRENSIRTFPFTRIREEHRDNETEVETGNAPPERETLPRRRPRKRKRPQENKMFFSPKYRPVQEIQDVPANEENNQNHNHLKNFASYPKDPAPYPTSSSIGGTNDDREGEPHSPYAPNFGPPPRKPVSQPPTIKNNEMLRPSHGPRQTFRRLRPWMWTRHRHRHRNQRPDSMSEHGHGHHHDHQQHPRPTAVSNIQSSPATSIYPVLNHLNPLSHLASIPLRHANAYNKLVNRAKQQNYFFQQHQQPPGHISYYELSTRKSDISDDDNPTKGNKTENDKVYYFNHNQRYAKNHLTSTLHPPTTSSSDVRNTLLDPVPGRYSTLIKVLPATMLPVNESIAESNLGHVGGVKNSMSTPAALIATTSRPLSAAESISITTQYPLIHPQLMLPQHSPSQTQAMRPFLPKNNNLLTFSFNLGNPDFKLGNQFGTQEHPFASNSRGVSKIMQGIKHGLLRPFGRAPLMAQQSALARPTLMAPLYHPNSFNVQRIPMPLYPSPQLRQQQQLLQYYPGTIMQRPHPQLMPMLMHNNNNPMGLPMPGMLSLGSKGEPQKVPAPLASRVSGIGRPKFYYKDELVNKTIQSDKHGITSNSTRGTINTELSKRSSYKPTLKVSSPTATAISSSTVTFSTTSKSTNVRSSASSGIVSSTQLASTINSAALQPQPPPFLNGIMNSVADFFGKAN